MQILTQPGHNLLQAQQAVLSQPYLQQNLTREQLQGEVTQPGHNLLLASSVLTALPEAVSEQGTVAAQGTSPQWSPAGQQTHTPGSDAPRWCPQRGPGPQS